MLTFSEDPEMAERQMHAAIFYLTAFGYIDGDFDHAERKFVRDTIEGLVIKHVDRATSDRKTRRQLIERFTLHFETVFQAIATHVRDLFTEAIAHNENHNEFIHTQLKLRCYEIFQEFDPPNQKALMQLIDELIEADGHVHPAERRFRREFERLLVAERGPGIEVTTRNLKAAITEIRPRPSVEPSPLFDSVEEHYSADPEMRARQAEADIELIDRTLRVWGTQRGEGKGQLKKKQRVSEFSAGQQFLDGHVYVHALEADASYEITVLGDLHGCYSCLKGAVSQSRFLERLEEYRKDPRAAAKPLLVFLGDYIDRGMFSFNGVMRGVMKLFLHAPEHVYVLRGNHEYFVRHDGQIHGGVIPAEAINSLRRYMPSSFFERFMYLFEAMPNMLLFDDIVFVHAGIPRDWLIKESWKGLSSLNDFAIRFQMMWSDPSLADVVPAELQQAVARFPFGRLQATAFLERIGCHTLIRGHQRVNSGFHCHYYDESTLLMTLFSAGGQHNADLPADSSYRTIAPMAMTVAVSPEGVEFTPWPIDYAPYNRPEWNRFFRSPPALEHISEG